MRKKAPGETKFSVVTGIVRDGQPFVTIPEVASLSFQVSDEVKARIASLRQELPAAPPAKRPRVGTAGPVAANAPNKVTMMKLLEEFVLLKSERHSVGVPPVNFTVVRAERKTDSAVFFYIQNNSSERCILPEMVHFCTSTKGVFLREENDEQRAQLRESTIHLS